MAPMTSIAACATARRSPAADRVRMTDPDEIFRMAFTSGTTGDPKCVLHSFNTTLHAGCQLNEDMKRDRERRAC